MGAQGIQLGRWHTFRRGYRDLRHMVITDVILQQVVTPCVLGAGFVIFAHIVLVRAKYAAFHAHDPSIIALSMYSVMVRLPLLTNATVPRQN